MTELIKTIDIFKVLAFFIPLSTALAIFLTILSMSEGITSIFPHIYYIPIILASYLYLKKGFYFSIILTLVYLFITIFFYSDNQVELIAAAIRSVVFLTVSFVIVYLRNKQKITETKLLLTQFSIDTDPEEIYFTNREGFFTYFNSAVCKSLGYTAKEIQNMDIFEINPKLSKEIWDKCWAHIQKKGHIDVETIHKRSDGTTYPVEAIMNYISFNEEEYSCHFSRDITERKQYEESIKNSEKLTSLILNGVSEGIIFLDEKFRIIRANNSAGLLVDLNPEDMAGKPCYEIFFGANTVCEGCIAKQTLVTGKALESEITDSKGRILHLKTNPVTNEKGEVTGIVETLVDVTESKKSKKALIQANKKLNLLSSITRHDILNQVTAIKLAGDLISLDGNISPEDETGNYINIILNATDTIQKQIGFTKDYEELGTESAAWQNIDSVVKKVIQNTIFDKISVKTNISGLEVYADPMLNKVIFNIFENSLRHGGNMTEIIVNFLQKEDTGILIIGDNGIGIPDDLKKTIFEKGVGSNTGLGLYLTREILDITGISIIENGFYKKGVRFEISIPGNHWRFKK